jgi:TolB protein
MTVIMSVYQHPHFRIRKWFAFLSVMLVFPLLISACLPLKTFMDRNPISALIRPSIGLIAYAGTDGNIYTVDLDGQNLHPVTNDARMPAGSDTEGRFYGFPTWSPDGHRLAFIATSRSSISTSTVSLYTAGPGRGNPLEVFSSQKQVPFYLYWSPDSQYLTFLTSGEGNDLFLQMVPADGGEVQILEKGQPFYWDWSPDDQRIFIHTGGVASLRPDARLSFLNLNEQVNEQKLDLRPASFQAPAWSPDGSELLLAAQVDGEQDALLLIDNQGTVERTLVKTHGAIAFAWSPDGSKFAYILDTNSGAPILSSPLSVIDPDRPEQPVTTLDDHVIAFFWSPDGRKIAYFVPVLESPADEQVQFGQPEATFRLSLRVLDISTAEAQELALFVPTGQFLNILPFFDQYHRSATIWSPDSQHIVYSALEAHIGSGIYTVRASGDHPPNRIAIGDLAFWSWK